MTVREALVHVRKHIAGIYSPDEQKVISRWIMNYVTHLDESSLVAHPDRKLTAQQQNLLNRIIDEHVHQHKPLQYIFGTVPFLGLSLITRPPVLIPRPETEYWCSYIIEQLKNLSDQHLTILDMCTGSGCIALALASAFPQAHVYAVDISADAYALATENAQRNNVPITVIQSNLFEHVPADVRFDVIISNPPYISEQEWETLDPSVKEWEDTTALIAPEEGLGILKKIIQESRKWLKSNAEMYRQHIPQIAVEFGYNQGKLVHALFSEAGYTHVTMHKDPWNNDRFITADYNGNKQT